MKSPLHRAPRWTSQSGQTFLVIAVFIGGFLLAVMGLATDYAQIWAHRQMTQGAADAACEAAAADLYLQETDTTASTDFPSLDFSWIGSGFDCSVKPNSAPCKYASLNGYSGSNVSVSFPNSLPGVAAIPAGFGTFPHPYVQVSISDAVPMSFTKLVSSSGTFTISAKAGCGLAAVNTPVPLVILHKTASSSLSVSGNSQITVFGGPQRSIQVDSSSATAAGVGIVDLSLGGPNNTGSDFGVFGGPTAQPASVNLGSTGNWIPRANPFGDPFASVAAPASAPATVGSATPVPFGMNGCPDPSGCVEFAAGNYTGCTAGIFAPTGNGCLMLPYVGSNPKFSAGGTDWQASHSYALGTLIVPASHNANTSMFKVIVAGTSNTVPNQPNPWPQAACARQSGGTCTGGTQTDGSVTWQNVGVVSTKPNTAIFDPGLYYVGAGGLNLGSNSSVRMSTAVGDGSNGVTFYFSTAATVGVTSNSGKSSACTSASSGSSSPNNCLVSYKVDGTVSTAATGYVASAALKCASGSAVPSQVPALVDGNILLGPCSGAYSSPDGNRGFLFFQKRSVAAQASWGGGGQFLSSGFLYFHNGNGATCGTNTSCLTLQGSSGAGSYTLGDIVVDELSLGGTPNIQMILNPTATFAILRPSLLE